jgi:hypothetical protein
VRNGTGNRTGRKPHRRCTTRLGIGEVPQQRPLDAGKIEKSSAGSLLDTVIAVLGNTLLGLTSGILAVGLHRTLKESPLPYGTNQIPPKAPVDPSGPA